MPAKTKKKNNKQFVVVGANVYSCPRPKSASGKGEITCKLVAKGAYIDTLFDTVTVYVSGDNEKGNAVIKKAVDAAVAKLAPRTYKGSAGFIQLTKNAHKAKGLKYRSVESLCELAKRVAYKIRESLEASGYRVVVRVH